MANTPSSTKGKDQFGSYTEKAKDMASSAAESAKETASTMTDKAKEMASNVGERASDAASAIGERAESATASVGSGMQSLAGTIRENMPHTGMVGSASSSLASSLESGGRYLQEEGLRGVADDLTNLIKRNPIPALFVGIGIGFLIARATTNRS